MATHIIEMIQKELGFPALQKMDPNIQDTKETPSTDQAKFAQAAIPSVLAGFFRYTRSDKGCNHILAGGGPKSWSDTIFEDKKDIVVEKVAHFSDLPIEVTAQRMEDIALTAAMIIHKGAGEQPAAEKIRSFMSGQRHNILVHLPASLQLGDLLNDNAMDDGTNKMEGPVSNFMHNIENKLSGGGE
ncbi:MAG TPA: hypothetical protein VIY47_10150 [Ignavibacteriaceae bacterium]